MSTEATVSLSLVSHTNAGKTTLARTLLGRDVGEVRDAPHVTEFADVHTLLEAPGGERLLLWDTPGFGDSARLVRRLRQSSNPIGWFMGQVWDRWRDRPLWSSQQALRNVRDEADVLLYLVSAAEAPEAAAYVAHEMEVLAWVDKPVIVLLNQLGPPGSRADEAAEVARWRTHLGASARIAAVLPLDAFARCWVQELTLWRAVEDALQGEARARMAALRHAWQQRQTATFDAAMQALAASLAGIATTAEPLPEHAGMRSTLRQAGKLIGLGPGETGPAERAQQTLAERLAEAVRQSTLDLIRLHGLSGEAHGEILARLATHYETRAHLDEGRAALWGGMLTGALMGLKADVLSGGLTLGGGLLTGGVLGALGAAGLARGVNLVRGAERSWVSWSVEALDAAVEAALLRYLAVAHFGRGRGDWAEGESPPHWREVVAEALAPQRDALKALWSRRPPPPAAPSDTDALVAPLQAVLASAAAAALQRLYPIATEVFDSAAALRESVQRPARSGR